MTNLALRRLQDYADKHRMSNTDLNQLAADYLVASSSEKEVLEQRALAGAAWIAVSRAVGRGAKSQMWELMEDQAQAGLAEIIPILQSYRPFNPATGKGTKKSFASYLTDGIDATMNHEFKQHISAVTRSVVDGSRQSDVPLGHSVTGLDGEEQSLDLPDGRGSVLDQLIHNYDNHEAAPQRERVALSAFLRAPLDQRRAIAAKAELTPNQLETVSRELRREFGLTGRKFNTGDRIELNPTLCRNFANERDRRNLTARDVVQQLATEMSARGITAKASSMYAILHAGTPSKNQKTVPTKPVAILRKIYRAIPVVAAIARDRPFITLRRYIEDTCLTEADFLGIASKVTPLTKPAQVNLAYNNLRANQGTVPLDFCHAMLGYLGLGYAHKDPPRQPSQTTGRVALTTLRQTGTTLPPTIVQYFTQLGARKELVWSEVEARLPADLQCGNLRDSSGTPLPARIKDSIIARKKIYASAPDKYYLPQDKPFTELQIALVAHQITEPDFIGIARQSAPEIPGHRASHMFHNLIYSRGCIPIAVAQHCLSRLAQPKPV